jgi:hypothetical protein
MTSNNEAVIVTLRFGKLSPGKYTNRSISYDARISSAHLIV